MASVINYYKCLRCGGVVYSDHNYKNGETWEMCQHCGWGRSIEYDRENDFKEKFREIDGKGAYCIMGKTGGGSGGSIPADISDDELYKFLTEVKENKEVAVDSSYIVLFDDKTKKFEVLFGEMPKLYSEEFEE